MSFPDDFLKNLQADLENNFTDNFPEDLPSDTPVTEFSLKYDKDGLIEDSNFWDCAIARAGNCLFVIEGDRFQALVPDSEVNTFSTMMVCSDLTIAVGPVDGNPDDIRIQLMFHGGGIGSVFLMFMPAWAILGELEFDRPYLFSAHSRQGCLFQKQTRIKQVDSIPAGFNSLGIDRS